VTSYIYLNYKYLCKQMSTCKEVIVFPLEATYLVWIDVSFYRRYVSEVEFLKIMDDCGIGIQTQSDFGMVEGLYVRLNIACPRETLEKGISRFIKGIEKIKDNFMVVI
ncbi:MAG: hypothetical protein ACK5NF_00925, partial [Bacilli bacterium]